MKKSVLYLLLTVMVGFTSCQEDLLYSCNEELNDWVIANMEDIHHLKRMEWCDLELQYQLPTFIAFTQEQKINFWLDKIKETMEMGWEEKELAHLQEFYDYIANHPDLYADDFNNECAAFEDFDRFQYEWTSYAKNELDWSEKLIYAIVADGNKLKDKEGNLDISAEKLKQFRQYNEQYPWCNCSSKAYSTCILGHCSKLYKCKQLACGAGLRFICDGMCL